MTPTLVPNPEIMAQGTLVSKVLWLAQCSLLAHEAQTWFYRVHSPEMVGRGARSSTLSLGESVGCREGW